MKQEFSSYPSSDFQKLYLIDKMCNHYALHFPNFKFGQSHLPYQLPALNYFVEARCLT